MPETSEDKVRTNDAANDQSSSPSDYFPSKEGPARNGASRQEILARRIFDLLNEEPGILQKDIFRRVSEKDILVLSLLDQLVADGLIERRGEPSRLYLIGEAPPDLTIDTRPAKTPGGKKGATPRADQRVENALVLLDTFRFCHRQLRLRVEVNDGLRAYRGERRILTVEFGDRGSQLTLHGHDRASLADTNPPLGSSGCQVEEIDADGSVLIKGRTRSSLSGALASLSAILSQASNGQKKAAER